MKKLVICIILLYTLTLIVYAGDIKSKALTIKDAVTLAVDNSEELKIGQQKLDMMNNTYKEVRASVFPQIGSEIGLDRYIESPVLKATFDEEEIEMPLKQEWDSRASITVSQVLWSFGKVFNAIKIAKRVIGLERLSIEAAENELGYGVKMAYYTMLLAQKTTKIAERSYENALTNKVALKTRFKSGRISMVNNVKMEADVAGRIPQVMRARSSLAQATIVLKDLLGLKEESAREISKAFLLAVIFTYMLLVAIMNSFRYPFVILTSVLTAFVGVFYILFFLEFSINIGSMMAMVMVVGLVVNNAILMLDYTLGRINEGKEVREALWLGASVKFRAILMTSLAIVFGALPQIFDQFEGKASIGAVIIGGMLASIFFTFFLIPVLFRYASKISIRRADK